MRASQDRTAGRTAGRVAFAATIGNMVCITAAVSATFGIFLKPISAEFGWPRATVTGVLGLIAIVAAFAYPLIGRAMDRFGSRPLLIGGNVALAALVASLALASGNVVLFYLQFAVVGIAGAVCSSAMFCKVVSNWFDERRGLMLGVTAGVGNGVGATVMPIVAGQLLPVLGWRGTFAAIGAIVFVVGFPILFLWLRDAPPHVATKEAPTLEGMTLREALRTRPFWLMLSAIAAGAGGMTAVFTHVVPMLTDHNVPLGEATGVVATFALVTAGWQVVTGALLDRVRAPWPIAPMYATAIAGLLLLEFGHGTAAVMGAGVLLGIGMGAEYGALSYFTSRYFGLRHYGAIIGALYAAVILAQGITPGLMDMSYDRSGSYDNATLAIVGALAVGMVLMLFLPPIVVPAARVRNESAEDELAGMALPA